VSGASRRRARSLAAFALACGPTAVAASGQVVLDNGVTRAVFTGPPGATPELSQLEDVAHGRPQLRFASGAATGRICGGFGLLLRRREDARPALRWVGADDPAFVVTAAHAEPAADGTDSLVVRHVAKELRFEDSRIAATVTVTWSLRPGARDLEARIAVEIPEMERLPVYLSQVKFPCLELRRLGDPAHVDALVLPFQSGVLLRDPVDAAAHPAFPQKLAGPKDGRPWMVQNLSLPLLACYDETTRDGLWFTDDDVTSVFRDYEVERFPGRDGAPVLELRCRHLPPDLYRSATFAPPYAMRIGPLRGDWVDVAERYRAFLAEPGRGATSYEGPVGAATNSMAPELKQVALHVNLSTGWYGDDLDLFARDATDVFRKAGEGGLEIWHGGFDEAFDDFYSHEEFGVQPSFVAAVRMAQKRFGTLVAPYVNGSRAVDYAELGVAAPGPRLRATHASVVRLESGAPFLLEQGRLEDVVQCNGARPWSGVFVERAFDVVAAARSHAVYLDAFGATPCFADARSDPEHAHDHAPGGGNYMFRGRREQLRQLRARAAAAGLPFAGVVVEGQSLAWLGAVDVMHVSPLGTLLLDRGNTRRVDAACTIPLFRMVADSVKLSDFPDHEPSSPPGRRAWLMAMDVFAFGLVPHCRNARVDLLPSHGDELMRDDEPYDRYLRRIVRCLRGDGFLRFHDGTLLRTPGFTVAGGADLPVRFDAFTPTGDVPFVEPWIATPLVAALYRAPDGARELAFVVTNPWVGGGPELRLHATLDPVTCGFANERCRVTVRDDAGKESVRHLAAGEPLVIDEQRIAPGEIWRWVLAKETDGASGR